MDSLAELAREAYAQGWAMSGGPMTDRVRAGCVAAVELVVEHADEPGVLEVALHLGKLEGRWAEIYTRRDDLHDRNRQLIGVAWADLVAAVKWDRLLRGLRRRMGLVLEAEDDGASASELAAIIAAAISNLAASGERWTKFRQVFHDALRAAWAEGRVGALALAAEQHGEIGFDFDLAWRQAYDALEHLAALWVETDRWIGDLISEAAIDVAQTVTAARGRGATVDEALTTLAEKLGSRDLRSLGVQVDLLTSRALSAGALGLYAAAGVDEVDYLTAGDGRVCPRCEEAESKNPWRTSEAPRPGLHPRCRCTVAATQRVPYDLIRPYLPEGA